VELKAYAKVNWDLHVLGKRPDNFHALDTVMVNVSLHDTLTFEPGAHLEFTCSEPSLPTDERNLVVKAAQLLAKAGGRPLAARIHLEKRIPPGGGMGGGSSDGACALLGLNKLWALDWPIARLQPLAAELGSDVAFFLFGGWRRCLGRGEIVESLPGAECWPRAHLLLIMPPLHVATPAVYTALQAPQWDGKTGMRRLADVARQVKAALNALDGSAAAALGTRNDLTAPARQVEPKLAPLQQVLEEHYPGRWLMSGSGAVHFAAARRQDDGPKLEAALTTACGPGIRVATVTTCEPEPRVSGL